MVHPPLPALKQSGENEIPNEKIRSYPATQGTGKEHSCSGADRRLRRKQGGEAGAAASETRVPPKERSGCWEPQPVLRLFLQITMFFYCIHLLASNDKNSCYF